LRKEGVEPVLIYGFERMNLMLREENERRY